MATTDTIRVFPTLWNNLIGEVGRGGYQILQFQREYVWEKTKILDRP